MDATRRAALEARGNERFAEAASLWRVLLRRAPDDWRAALELKADLASGYHYSESDPLFRRAARSMPDEAWLSHYAGLWTFHTADLSYLAARATALLAQRPGDSEVMLVLGNALLQQRRWAAAERHLARMPATPDIAAKRALAGLYRRLKRDLDCATATVPYEVALLNLDGNAGRRRDIEREFRHSRAPLTRIPAVRGSLLSAPAVRRLAGEAAVTMRGTLGCFLSHVAAWEWMLARGLAHCLVIEDDVVPQLSLPSGLDALALPEGYDFCFVNDRMQPRWPAERVAASERFVAVPLAEAFASFPAEDNAPGADGYLVSAAGARKLLAWVEEGGFAHDVDWRLLAYGLTDTECAGLPRHSHAWGVLDVLRHLVGRPDRLRAYALHPALIRTVPISSDREDGNREATPHSSGSVVNSSG